MFEISHSNNCSGLFQLRARWGATSDHWSDRSVCRGTYTCTDRHSHMQGHTWKSQIYITCTLWSHDSVLGRNSKEPSTTKLAISHWNITSDIGWEHIGKDLWLGFLDLNYVNKCMIGAALPLHFRPCTSWWRQADTAVYMCLCTLHQMSHCAHLEWIRGEGEGEGLWRLWYTE